MREKKKRMKRSRRSVGSSAGRPAATGASEHRRRRPCMPAGCLPVAARAASVPAAHADREKTTSACCGARRLGACLGGVDGGPVDVAERLCQHRRPPIHGLARPVEDAAEHIGGDGRRHDVPGELELGGAVVNPGGALEHLHHGLVPVHLQHLPAPGRPVAQTNVDDLRILGILDLRGFRARVACRAGREARAIALGRDEGIAPPWPARNAIGAQDGQVWTPCSQSKAQAAPPAAIAASGGGLAPRQTPAFLRGQCAGRWGRTRSSPCKDSKGDEMRCAAAAIQRRARGRCPTCSRMTRGPETPAMVEYSVRGSSL